MSTSFPKRRCATEFCKNKAHHHKRFCNTCRSAKYREKYPIKYAYDMVKKSAKKRGHEFTVSLKYFTELCNNTGYIEKKGRLLDSFTIDRKNASKGYVEGNLQVITKSANSLKYHQIDKGVISGIYVHSEDDEEGFPF